MPFLYRYTFMLGLCLLVLVGVGCDTAATDSVDALVDEADIAITRGDAAKAVQLLEEALAAAPGNKRVKATLAIALIEANDITIFDVEAIFDALSGETSTLAKRQQPATTCAPAGVDQAGQTFDPTATDDVSSILADYAVLARIQSLLDDVLPADLSGLTLADVQAQLASVNIATSKVSAVLLARALAATLTTYTDLFFVNTGTPSAPTFSVDPDVTFYRVAGPPSYYGFCAEDAKYATVCATARNSFGTLENGIDALEVRSSQGADDPLVQQAREALAALQSELDEC